MIEEQTNNRRIYEDEINLLDYWKALLKRKMVIEIIVIIACKIRVVIGSRAEYCPLYWRMR